MYKTEIASFNKESHEQMREVRGIQTYRSRAVLLSALKYGSVEVVVAHFKFTSFLKTFQTPLHGKTVKNVDGVVI
jgi:hypothetical protein